MSSGTWINHSDCYFHPDHEAVLACKDCGKYLCEACCDEEYPGFCYVCSLAVRNGDSPVEAQDQKLRVGRYILMKLLAAVISVMISTVVWGGIMHGEDGELLLAIGLVSLLIVTTFGVPSSIGIDFMCRRIRARWVRTIAKALLHGLAGLTLAQLIFSNSGWNGLITSLGCLYALVYYAVYVFFEKPGQP
ncbi:hypothetical protein [Paenibacillus sacheonensis]|uniref:B box-type domain-containing protein n=1 Tax=Paenibacillus sacheonensis TaxID=742054 RepID=A0A7X4YPS7_9BACL|nr:hypothetical protein [Paenibacillus sacheonensis]MBM7564915.1 hypothetical protein [Paenibacillus sacheonensis]NBC70295.1 hypothetical protein [Paenibacillus sacheonensis]